MSNLISISKLLNKCKSNFVYIILVKSIKKTRPKFFNIKYSKLGFFYNKSCFY